MKLTKSKLKQIIKEELKNVQNEGLEVYGPDLENRFRGATRELKSAMRRNPASPDAKRGRALLAKFVKDGKFNTENEGGYDINTVTTRIYDAIDKLS